MSLSLHTLSPAKGSRTKSFRIGRGLGTGRGKTSGRGTKGQRSRTGGRNKLKMRGMRHMVLSYPKMKGFQSRYAKDTTITLSQLERVFSAGSLVQFSSLREHGLMKRVDRGVKIVATGTLTKQLIVAKEINLTATARKAIETAGGTIRS